MEYLEFSAMYLRGYLMGIIVGAGLGFMFHGWLTQRKQKRRTDKDGE